MRLQLCVLTVRARCSSFSARATVGGLRLSATAMERTSSHLRDLFASLCVPGVSSPGTMRPVTSLKWPCVIQRRCSSVDMRRVANPDQDTEGLFADAGDASVLVHDGGQQPQRRADKRTSKQRGKTKCREPKMHAERMNLSQFGVMVASPSLGSFHGDACGQHFLEVLPVLKKRGFLECAGRVVEGWCAQGAAGRSALLEMMRGHPWSRHSDGTPSYSWPVESRSACSSRLCQVDHPCLPFSCRVEQQVTGHWWRGGGARDDGDGAETNPGVAGPGRQDLAGDALRAPPARGYIFEVGGACCVGTELAWSRCFACWEG